MDTPVSHFSSGPPVQSDIGDNVPGHNLSLRSQGALLACAAVAVGAGLFFFQLASGRGQPPAGAGHIARFVPGSEQKSAMQFETVRTRLFQTETITDGYVAANGGWATAGGGSVAHDIPVLQGQSADLIQAEGDLATARAQLAAATANEQRQHALYQADGASLKDWQQAQVDATTAASALAAARNKLRLMGKSDADILALERGNPGAAGRVFTIGSSSQVWLVANVREADAPHVHVGDSAEVSIPALGSRRLRVSITYMSSTIDPATHRLAVAALYKNADGVLKPNMLANFDIMDRDSAMAPSVPSNAVIYEGEQARVWVEKADGTFTLRNVSVGRSREGYAEIPSGLSAGERIVTGGALFLDQASKNG